MRYALFAVDPEQSYLRTNQAFPEGAGGFNPMKESKKTPGL
jgi:hypothetical protein